MMGFAESLLSDEVASSSQNSSIQVMDRASRNELVKTVESLGEQLQQYKAKLRDVVSAYKSLAKEKEALESSLAVLSTTTPTAEASAKDNSHLATQHALSTGSDATNSQEGSNDPLGISSDSADGDSGQSQVAALREQLKTLTVSLTTLNQEKKRLESQFVADNKQLRQENEELQTKLDEEKQMLAVRKMEFEMNVQELKGRIRSQQLEREKEQTDHVVMLREMQKLLAEERTNKEQLELQLDEARRNLQDADTNLTISQQYEKKIQHMAEELSKMRQSLQEEQVKASHPSPFVLDLQKEMAKLKAQHQEAVRQEQSKALEAESRLKQQSKLSEERISSLEDKLSELSEVVGNYERLRFQDQQAIQKLKERLTQLDVENTALVRANKTFGGSDTFCDDNLDAQALYDKLLHLKTRLLSVNQQSERPVDLSGLFQVNKSGDTSCSACQQHREELEQVKEEFERYKLRAQSVLKNKHKDTTSKEVEGLKEQVSDLRERLKMSAVHHHEELEAMQVKVDGLSRSLLAQADGHKAEVSHLKNAHQKEVFVLELEARKQRERTVALLAEKDQEIEKLRAGTFHRHDLDLLPRLKDLSVETSRDGDGLNHGEGESEAGGVVARLLLQPPAQGEAGMLHFSQERARQDVEIGALRKQKHQLENALRELQHSLSLKEERAEESRAKLEEQIHKLERDKGREGANLEYLKNVFLKFLVSSDSQGRSQMLKAITTILQFSPAEKDSVRLNMHL